MRILNPGSTCSARPINQICEVSKINGKASRIPQYLRCILKYLKKKTEPIQVVTGRFHLPPINKRITHPVTSQRMLIEECWFLSF
jgi:hypothetical protein